MKTRARKPISLMLSLAMAVTLLPAVTLPASADSSIAIMGVEGADVDFPEMSNPVRATEGMTITSDEQFGSSSYLEFSIDDSNAYDQLDLKRVDSKEDINTASGEISVVKGDNIIYMGNGTGYDAIASIDSTENGEDGQPLKIVFTRTLPNADFSTGETGTDYTGDSLDGWKIMSGSFNADGKFLNSNGATGLTGAGLNLRSNGRKYTSISDKKISDETHDVTITYTDSNDAANSYTYHSDWYYPDAKCKYGAQEGNHCDQWGYESSEQPDGALSTHVEIAERDAENGNCLYLNSSGSVDYPPTGNTFGSHFGPAVESDTFTAKKDEDLSIDWKAVADDDDYEVYGYVINESDSTPTLVFYGRGNKQDWTTTTGKIPADGTYRFLFINGTYDQTGGGRVGSNMLIDNIKVFGSKYDASVATKISVLVTYQCTSEDPEATRTLDTKAVDESNTDATASKTINITNQYSHPPELTATAANPAYNHGADGESALFSACDATAVEQAEHFTGLTLTASGLTDGDQEILTADGTDIVLTNGASGTTTDHSISYSVSVDAGTATVTFTDMNLSDDAMEGFVTGLNYKNPANPLTAGDRTFTLTEVTDSGKANGGGDDKNENTTSLSTASTATASNVVSDFANATDSSPSTTGSSGQAPFTWSAATGATAVVLEQSTDNGSHWTTATYSDTLDADSTSATVTGLDGTKTYQFRLKVTGGDFEGASNVAEVKLPTVAFTTPASTSGNGSENPYKDSSVTFSLTKGTNDIASYQVGTGDADSVTYGDPVTVEAGATSVEYMLEAGEYHQWIRAVDVNGNTSVPINLYVNAKKQQILSGTDTYTFEVGPGLDTGATLDFTSKSSDPAEGESLGAITYEITTNPGDHVISLADGVVTAGNYLGTATITVSAAETPSHFAASKTITIKVVKPFSVSLASTDYSDTGITILPSYTDGGSFGVSDSTRELKYRAVGATDWITVPADSWNWNTKHTLNFSDLTAGTEYEVQLSGQNGRTTPTTASATLKFKTPGTSSPGTTATPTYTLESTESGKPYYISVQEGDTVLQSETVTGTGRNIIGNLSALPDGFYNVVVEYGNSTVTKPLEIKDGQQVGSLIINVGAKSTRVTVAENSPNIVVDDLNELYGDEVSKDTAGITHADNTVITNGGSALVELVSTGKTEADIPDDVEEIESVSDGQSLALLVDLSLYKTIRASGAAQGNTTQMTTSSKLITIAIPLNKIHGTNLSAYRVHDSAAQMIPEAKENNDGQNVWANTYNIDGLTLTKGAAIGVDDEYVVFTDGYANLHVKKFSTYAVGYTPISSKDESSGSIGGGSGSGGSSYTASIEKAENGTITASPTSQTSGYPVTLKVTPDDGYRLGSLRIKDAAGKTVKCTENSDGTYSFIMPTSAVQITPTFVKNLTTPSKTGVAKQLITEDHIKYMNGDSKGYFNPGRNMTRAQAAQMFYNLLLDKDVAVSAHFSDVPDDMWCTKSVETLAALGVINGYSDGTYRPDGYITRAQFAAIAMRFADVTTGTASYSDVPEDYWAYHYIMSAAGYGWISGYSDGTFRPGAYISRAQVVTVVNNMLGRSADKSYVDNHVSSLKIFPDVSDSSYWAYYNIVEATNAHDHVSSNGQETWTGLKADS